MSSLRPGTPGWPATQELRALAPDAVDAFGIAFGALAFAAPPLWLELARRRVVALLQTESAFIPLLTEAADSRLEEVAQWPSSELFTAPDRAVLGFTEQFVIDVAGIEPVDRAALTGALGDAAVGFVQALYVMDHGSRLCAAFQQIFGANPIAAPPPGAPQQLWPALQAVMTAVARLRSLDPLTAELIRLRGARFHHCRLCSSRRRVAAAALGSELLEDADPAARPDLTGVQRAALALTEGMLLTPAAIPPAVIAAVRAELSPQQAAETALLVAHNAANKIAVAFAVDAPSVSEGVEFFELDEAGDYTYGLPPPG
jgi:alkylhydroperoxidase family enzyme